MTFVITQHGVETRFVGVYGKLYGDCFARNQFYEQGFLDHIRGLGRTGTYLDVGANVGNHTLFFARLCRAERIYAFEPLPKYAERIAANLAANEVGPPVEVMRFGLADVSGRRTIDINGRTHEIETRRLDDLELAGTITVIKLDVEGMEALVLRGGLERIRRDRPAIYAEAHRLEDLERITATLAPCGYALTGARWNATPTYELTASV